MRGAGGKIATLKENSSSFFVGASKQTGLVLMQKITNFDLGIIKM
jgi:hypothetical protein